MSTLSLHLAIHNANIEIRKATKASDDYMHATTEVIFNALWDLAPRTEWQEDLWEIALGGDSSGSWIAKLGGDEKHDHKFLLLSSCGKSDVIEYDCELDHYGHWRKEIVGKSFHVLGRFGDDLREIINGVIRTGDFYGIGDVTNPLDARAFTELPPPDEWIANLAEFLSKQPGQGRAEDIDPATFKEPIKEGFIPGEPVGRNESGTLSLTGACRQLTGLDPERRKEIIDNILGSKPGVHRTVGQRWQPTGGKELVKNLREYQEDQERRLPRDVEGNVADFVPDDSPTR